MTDPVSLPRLTAQLNRLQQEAISAQSEPTDALQVLTTVMARVVPPNPTWIQKIFRASPEPQPAYLRRALEEAHLLKLRAQTTLHLLRDIQQKANRLTQLSLQADDSDNTAGAYWNQALATFQNLLTSAIASHSKKITAYELLIRQLETGQLQASNATFLQLVGKSPGQ